MLDIRHATKQVNEEGVIINDTQMFYFHDVDENGDSVIPRIYAALHWVSGRLTLIDEDDYDQDRWDIILSKTPDIRRPMLS